MRGSDSAMRVPVFAVVGLISLSVIASTFVFACGPPPIEIYIVGRDGGVVEKDGELSGTVELGATIKEGVEVEVVEFFCDGTSIGKDDTEPYVIKWDTTTVEDGEHKLHTVATKPDGTTIKSRPLTVQVANKQEDEKSEPAS